jgi:hypothetical protein
MENRKSIILIILLLIFIGFKPVLSYEIETHAYLTKEIIDFYNQNFSNKIPQNLIPYLIDGSRKEDEPPRWMNHFYDPVYNRGLSQDAAIDPNYRLGNYEKSKDWANDSNNQNNPLYKTAATIFSILSAIEQKNLGALTTESDFTWDRALKFYIQGNKEKAMYILGHILHLIEDASVPDHTRNDPHAQGSPYEKYSGKYNLNNFDQELKIRLNNKKPIILNSLEEYFDNLAIYSNNNFYSKDTIGIQSGYDKPQPIDFEIKNDLRFGLGRDENYFYKLYVQPIESSLLISIKGQTTIDNQQVLKDYWSRLSTKAVLNGAGVLDLFFREAEANKNNPKYLEKEFSLWDKIKNTTSNIINSVASFGSQAINTTRDFLFYVFNQNKNQNTYEIPINNNLSQTTNNNQNTQTQNQNLIQAQNQPKPNQNQSQNNIRNQNQDEFETEEPFIPLSQNSTNTKTNTKTETQIKQITTSTLQINQAQTAKQCSFAVNQIPTHQGVIINEVAWMGTPESSNNEWIELKNISNQEIDLTNWQLIDKSEQIKINFSNLLNPKIKPQGFILLERTSDNTLPNILADLIYSGALSNQNEGLRLFDQNCNLVDEVLANPNWPAGNSSTRQTAERKSDLSWQTSQNTRGTPKQENSIGYIGGGGSPAASNQNSTPAPDLTSSNQNPILISEIQISPTNQRFIELYNPNNFDLDLTGYYLQRKTQSGSSFTSLVSKTYFEGKIIKAKSFLLISREALASSDIILPNLTLTDSNTIQLKDKDGNVIDLVGWGNANDCQSSCAPSIADGQSLQRKFENGAVKNSGNNSLDFEISNCPSPKSPPNQNCSLNQASSDAFFGYSNTSHIVLSEILFNPEGSDREKEFIELYNPTSKNFDLTGWSLKIIKSGSTSTNSLATFKSNENPIIKSRSFLLIGFSNYSSQEKPADILRSTQIPNDFEAIILYDKDDNEIDRFNYTEYKNQFSIVPEGYSIERKAYKNKCEEPFNSFEFFGNGCDNDEITDFSMRLIPNPQNSKNLPEPRKAPEIIGLKSNYNNQDLNIKLTWEDSKDEENQTSTLTYKLIAKTNSNSSSTSSSTSSATHESVIFESKALSLAKNQDGLFEKIIPVYELNKEYNFEFQALDRDGFYSASSINIFAKSFIDDGYFFRDPKTGKYYFTLKFNPDYKFFDKNDVSEFSSLNYQGIVFFLNQEPSGSGISTENGDLTIPNSNQLTINYPACLTGPSKVLVFPQNKRSCLKGGGHLTWFGTWAYDFNSLEDDIITFEVLIQNDLSSNDYVSLGLYNNWRGNMADFQFLDFKARDSKKYYLQNNTSHLQAPKKPKEPILTFNPTSQKLSVSSNGSTDLDSLDSNINYEYNYSTSTELNPQTWQKTPYEKTPQFEIDVLYPYSYTIGLRAIDDFGNISEPEIKTWSFPNNFLILINQNIKDETSNPNAVAVAQVFSPKESGYLTGIKLYLSSYILMNWQRWRNDLNVSLYNYTNSTNAENLTDFINSIIDQNKIAVSNNINNAYIQENNELYFDFSSKPFLEKDKKYIWILGLGSGYGNLAGTSIDQNIGGYGYAAYAGTGWTDERPRLTLTNYYFVLVGEK